jgi:hypothetical protein
MSKSYVTRRGAAEYCTGRGLPMTAQTLARIAATSGDGPVYARWGNRAVYALADLDAWIGARLQPRRSSQTIAVAA